MEIKYMQRAIELAQKGRGHTSPNPLVGAVLAKQDRIIGEGYRRIYGGPHAEVEAVTSTVEDVKGATMYVTLEPCAHFGKTPPCARMIVEKRISKVIVGMIDPNPMVAGKGIEILRDNGIVVVTGVLENEAERLNEIFIKYITTGMPFCILKTAMTLDGKIATATGESKWITNAQSRQFVHELRHSVSAIMVGVGTILTDNPLLTTRLCDREGTDPVRLIVDTTAKIPLESKVLNSASNVKTILATTEKADKDRMQAILRKGVEIIITPLKEDKVDMGYLFKRVGAMGIDSILVEGGSTLNYSLIKEGLVDKFITFIAPKIVGGSHAKTPVGGEGISRMEDALLLNNMSVSRFGEDIMIEGYAGKGE